jgi:hypothetical protein
LRFRSGIAVPLPRIVTFKTPPGNPRCQANPFRTYQ